jgi:hypothetical protein
MPGRFSEDISCIFRAGNGHEGSEITVSTRESAVSEMIFFLNRDGSRRGMLRFGYRSAGDVAEKRLRSPRELTRLPGFPEKG